MSYLVKREDKNHDKNGKVYCNMEFINFPNTFLVILLQICY